MPNVLFARIEFIDLARFSRHLAGLAHLPENILDSMGFFRNQIYLPVPAAYQIRLSGLTRYCRNISVQEIRLWGKPDDCSDPRCPFRNSDPSERLWIELDAQQFRSILWYWQIRNSDFRTGVEFKATRLASDHWQLEMADWRPVDNRYDIKELMWFLGAVVPRTLDGSSDDFRAFGRLVRAVPNDYVHCHPQQRYLFLEWLAERS